MSASENRTRQVGNSQVSVGRYSYGHENLIIEQWDEGAALKIGAFCSIANPVTIFLGGNHRTDWVTTYPFGHIYQEELGGEDIGGHPATKGDVIIGNDVWIGNGATIMSGVRIGDGSVIAANATITKDVAPYQIVGGNPAKLIRQRFDDQIVKILLELQWWDLPIEQIRTIQKVLCAPPDLKALSKLLSTYRKL